MSEAEAINAVPADGAAPSERNSSGGLLPAPNDLSALLYYLAGVALLAFMDATVKDVAGRYPTAEVGFMRNASGLLVIAQLQSYLATEIMRGAPSSDPVNLSTEAMAELHTLQSCEVLLLPRRDIHFETLWASCTRLLAIFGSRMWLGVELLHALDDALWLHALERVAQATGVPLVACGNVHMHVRSRKPLQDVVSAVRLGLPVAACGFHLQVNAETHMRARARLERCEALADGFWRERRDPQTVNGLVAMRGLIDVAEDEFAFAARVGGADDACDLFGTEDLADGLELVLGFVVDNQRPFFGQDGQQVPPPGLPFRAHFMGLR